MRIANHTGANFVYNLSLLRLPVETTARNCTQLNSALRKGSTANGRLRPHPAVLVGPPNSVLCLTLRGRPGFPSVRGVAFHVLYN